MCAHPAYEKDTTEEISLPQASYVCLCVCLSEWNIIKNYRPGDDGTLRSV